MNRIDFGRKLAERYGWVGPDATNAQVIQALADNGVTTVPGNYRSDDEITRAEAATMFVRASGGEATTLEQGLEQAVNAGIFTTPGHPNAIFQEGWFDRTATNADAGDIDWETVRSYEDWEKVVQERFPGWAWALDHPELSPILAAAAEGDFTADTFNAQIRATEWFTSRTEAERSWDARASDPANAEQMEREVEEMVGQVTDLAGQLGVTGFSPEDFTELATDALRRGLSMDEVTGMLVAGTDAYSSGSLAGAQAEVRRLASEFFVTIDDETQRSIAAKVATGEMNADGMSTYVQDIARQQFPQFEDLIDRGISLREYTAPQRQTIASMLGRSPEDIDLMSPEFNSVLRFGDGGNLRTMTLDETTRFVRTRDDYWQGQQGQGELHGMVNGLTRALGARR